MAARVFIGIGSNIDPARHVGQALTLLTQHLTLTGLSTLYQTRPVGRPDQDLYYNGVCMGTTGLTPVKLHHVLRTLEKQLGRRRTADRFAARTIDLDLLLHDRCVMNHDGLILPNPDITLRAFVCLPLLELDSELTMPDSGARLAAIAGQLDCSDMSPLPDYTRHLKETLSL